MNINFQDSAKPIIKPYSFAQRVNPRSFDIEMFIKRINPKITIRTPYDNPAYVWGTDTIEIQDIRFYNSAALYYKTFFHELIHFTGNRNRLNRSIAGHPDNNQKEETVAELGAYLLCVCFGFGTTIYDYSYNYIRQHGKEEWIEECTRKANKAIKYLVSLVAL